MEKFSFSNLMKNSDLNIKFAKLAMKAELKWEQDNIVKL